MAAAKPTDRDIAEGLHNIEVMAFGEAEKTRRERERSQRQRRRLNHLYGTMRNLFVIGFIALGVHALVQDVVLGTQLAESKHDHQSLCDSAIARETTDYGYNEHLYHVYVELAKHRARSEQPLFRELIETYRSRRDSSVSLRAMLCKEPTDPQIIHH